MTFRCLLGNVTNVTKLKIAQMRGVTSSMKPRSVAEMIIAVVGLTHHLDCAASSIEETMSPYSRRHDYSTPALEKGLDILELFASNPGGLTASEAARVLNRTISEIFRMLLCLEQRGYLSQSGNREKYHLTPRIFRLAQEHPPTSSLITESLPLMRRVAHELRQSCHLDVLDGGYMVILAQVDAPESTGFHVKIGSKMELMQSATGHVILAYQSEDLRRHALEEWARETQRNKPADLDARLAKVCRRGHEICASLQVKGVVNVCFPVFAARGEAVACLAVPYVKRLEDKIGVPEVVRALRISSGELSDALGATRLNPRLVRTRNR